jgi:hypothetical protein
MEVEDFHAYAQIKAFDVISSGHFKKHLSISRDNGDKWAVQMYSRHNLVQGKVRDIFRENILEFTEYVNNRRVRRRNGDIRIGR